MSKFFKGITVAVLLALAVPGLFAAGGSDRAADSAKAGGPVPIIMGTHGAQTFATKPKYYDQVLAAINEKLLKDKGITIAPTVLSYPDEGYVEKVNLDIAAGRTYEFLRVGTDEKQAPATLYVRGIIQDITGPLNKHGQNLLANIPRNVWDEVTVDGKILGIPMPAFPFYLNSWIRGDWLDKAGLKVPTTLAEMETVLKAFRDLDLDGNGRNDTIPWVIPFDNIEHFLYGIFSANPGDFVDAAGNVRPKWYDPGYKSFVELLARWYREKYIDESLFKVDENQAIDLYGKNLTGINGGNIWQLEWGTLNAIDKARPEMKTTFLRRFDKEIKKHPSLGITTEVLVVPVTAKNVDAAIKYADWLMYNKENYFLNFLGIEGLTYVINGDAVGIPEAEKGPGAEKPDDLKGHFFNGYNASYNFTFWPPSTPAQSKLAYQYCAGADLSKVYVPITKFLGVSLPESTRMDFEAARADATAVVHDIIRGRIGLDSYSQVLAAFEKAGGLDAYKLYTAAYKASKK